MFYLYFLKTCFHSSSFFLGGGGGSCFIDGELLLFVDFCTCSWRCNTHCNPVTDAITFGFLLLLV